jgi:hypothetical protein
MTVWRVRVFGPRHQIEAAALALSGSDWSVAQSDDACDLITTNSLLEADAASVADKAGRKLHGSIQFTNSLILVIGHR